MTLFMTMLERAEASLRQLAASADAAGRAASEHMANEIRELLANTEANEWRELHASLQSLHRKMDSTMNQLDQLNAAITRVAADITTAVETIKSHPAAPDLADPIAKLSAAADALEAVEVPSVAAVVSSSDAQALPGAADGTASASTGSTDASATAAPADTSTAAPTPDGAPDPNAPAA